MNLKVGCLALTLFAAWPAAGQNPDSNFARFHLAPAPRVKPGGLRPGDRLAICGDSITEQRMYSRIMETYLTVALPDWNIGVRQFGWSGEKASGFLMRMTNDVLRFHPTVATTCYGMNDHLYKAYEASIGESYASNMTDVALAFKSAGVRLILGSPGCMGLHAAPWARGLVTAEDDNRNLGMLRNIDIQIAEVEGTRFADVFWPMLRAQFVAVGRFGTNYALAGKDSVHPNWAGHLVMAYAFLKAMDLPGDIGEFTVDLGAGKANVSAGHRLISFTNGAVTIESARYPFCAAGPDDVDTNIRSGMALVPFNRELNRLTLVVKHGNAAKYKVTWGESSREYSAAELGRGVNLADDFQVNPFSTAFKRVDAAVGKKQAFETGQVKKMMHGPKGREDMEKTVADTEEQRAALVADIQKAFTPVTHTIEIQAE